MHYYQFNIGDYAKSTLHLSMMEDLAYRRLLDLYYDSEKPLELDLNKLCRLIRMQSYETETQQVLSEFFKSTKKGWVQKRVAIELSAYSAKADAARANGKLGGRPKKTQSVNLANPDLTQPKAKQEPLNIKHKPLTNNHIKETAQAPEWMDQYIDLFWNAYPKKVDKKKTVERLKKLIKVKPDKQFFSMILDRVRTKALITDKQFWPTADRYLRDEKWADEIINMGINNGSQTTGKLSLAERQQRDTEAALALIASEENNNGPMDSDGPAIQTQMGVSGRLTDEGGGFLT